MRGRGFGPAADILLGLLGGIVGSVLLGVVGINLSSGIIGGLIIGTLGAVVVVYVARALGRSTFAQ